ncbi:Phosphatidylserine decarboxylase proenzyme 3 [Branchiostoma belcheri]|nr:Phosphatidylserine decarboxylase proenzyme 3 [Branchiostoma belcheri]
MAAHDPDVRDKAEELLSQLPPPRPATPHTPPPPAYEPLPHLGYDGIPPEMAKKLHHGQRAKSEGEGKCLSTANTPVHNNTEPAMPPEEPPVVTRNPRLGDIQSKLHSSMPLLDIYSSSRSKSFDHRYCCDQTDSREGSPTQTPQDGKPGKVVGQLTFDVSLPNASPRIESGTKSPSADQLLYSAQRSNSLQPHAQLEQKKSSSLDSLDPTQSSLTWSFRPDTLVFLSVTSKVKGTGAEARLQGRSPSHMLVRQAKVEGEEEKALQAQQQNLEQKSDRFLSVKDVEKPPIAVKPQRSFDRRAPGRHAAEREHMYVQRGYSCEAAPPRPPRPDPPTRTVSVDVHKKREKERDGTQTYVNLEHSPSKTRPGAHTLRRLEGLKSPEKSSESSSGFSEATTPTMHVVRETVINGVDPQTGTATSERIVTVMHDGHGLATHHNPLYQQLPVRPRSLDESSLGEMARTLTFIGHVVTHKPPQPPPWLQLPIRPRSMEDPTSHDLPRSYSEAATLPRDAALLARDYAEIDDDDIPDIEEKDERKDEDDDSDSDGEEKGVYESRAWSDSDSDVDLALDREPGSPKKVDIPSAKRLAKRLYNLDGFKKSDVARHLSKKNEFNRLVAQEYLAHFDFSGHQLDIALRTFLKAFSLTGETQERERVLMHFSHRYHECNPAMCGSEDAVHTLTCALMLLNTDLHGQHGGKRMTLTAFIDNLSGLNDGNNFNKDTLKALYHSIKSEPIEWAVDEEEKEGAAANKTGNESTSSPGIGDNPFLDVPRDPNAVTFKQGFLLRKCTVEADGRKTPLGKRGWKMFYASLKGLILFMHKEEYRYERQVYTEDIRNSISIHHSLASKATDYKKRPNVFRLRTAEWRIFLFQASDQEEMQDWMTMINLAAASLSSPPLPAAIGSQKKFRRPVMPVAPTRLTPTEQLQHHENKHHENNVRSTEQLQNYYRTTTAPGEQGKVYRTATEQLRRHHENKVQSLEQELAEHRQYAPDKRARSHVIREWHEKHNYLEFEKQSESVRGIADSEPANLPADSEPANLPADSEPATLPADSEPANLPADSEPANLPADSEPANLPADSEPANPADSEPANLPADSEPANLPADSEPANLPADSEPANLPADSEPATLPADSEPANLLADSEPANLPADSEPANHPADSEPANLPADSEPANLPADSEPANLPADSEPANLPADSEPANLPADSEPANLPADSEPANHPADSEPANLPADFEPANLPADSEPANLPADSEPANLPADSEPANLPADSEPANHPADSEPANLPADFEPANLPADSEPANLPADSEPANLPADSEPANLPADSEPANLPADSEPANLPVDSEPANLPADSEPANLPKPAKFC